MRQPTPLEIIITAIPDDRLRPLLLELLQKSAAPVAPAASAETTATAPSGAPAKPRGRPRGARTEAATVKMIADVAAGRVTRAAAGRALGHTAKTISAWTKK